jgi:CRISPR system Cascade subunit CasE
MFLSKLVLNSRDRQARRDLASPYELHRTLWRAFPEPDPGRVLFRVDAPQSGGAPVVLVQSDLRPQWDRLCQVVPRYLLAPPDFKEFEPSFTRGQRLRFRLRANPTKKVASLTRAERLAGVRVRDENSKNGRRLALLREHDQVTWLLHKGEHAGFRIPGEWTASTEDRQVANFRVEVISEGWVRLGKEGHTGGRFYAVRFEGMLEVTDPERLRCAVGDGIGSAKGFGFGLLSLAPYRGES